MPSDQATEKSDLLLKLGAIVDRVPPAPIVDPKHFVNRARELAAEHTRDPNRQGRGYFADQFENGANWQAHYEGTGQKFFGNAEEGCMPLSPEPAREGRYLEWRDTSKRRSPT